MAKASAFEAVTRNMVDDLKEDVNDIKIDMKEGFNNIDVRITELFNHNSNKWPPTAVWALTLIGMILSALATTFIMRIFGF
jgi:hypothetical protein